MNRRIAARLMDALEGAAEMRKRLDPHCFVLASEKMTAESIIDVLERFKEKRGKPPELWINLDFEALSQLIIEQLGNCLDHGLDENGEDPEHRGERYRFPVAIAVGRDPVGGYVWTANFVSPEEGEGMKLRLQRLAVMPEKELSQRFRRRFRPIPDNLEEDPWEGGGLGMMAMAKLASSDPRTGVRRMAADTYPVAERVSVVEIVTHV